MNPEKCCERCVFGTGLHAAWCRVFLGYSMHDKRSAIYRLLLPQPANAYCENYDKVFGKKP